MKSLIAEIRPFISFKCRVIKIALSVVNHCVTPPDMDRSCSKRDNGLQHNSSQLQTAALARDSIDLWQKSNNFKGCLNSIHPSLIPCTDEWKEHRRVGEFSLTLKRFIHPGLILHPFNNQHFVGVMGNKLFFKFNTVIDILGVDIYDSYSYC